MRVYLPTLPTCVHGRGCRARHDHHGGGESTGVVGGSPPRGRNWGGRIRIAAVVVVGAAIAVVAGVAVVVVVVVVVVLDRCQHAHHPTHGSGVCLASQGQWVAVMTTIAIACHCITPLSTLGLRALPITLFVF